MKTVVQPKDDAEVFEGIAEEFGEDFEAAVGRLSPRAALTGIGKWVMAKGYALALAERRHRDRVRLRTAPTPSSKGQKEIARRALTELYRLWMIGETPLGKVTNSDLISAATREEAIADGHTRNATFYRRLADRCPEGKVLEDVLPAEEAHKIRAAVFQPPEATPRVQEGR